MLLKQLLERPRPASNLLVYDPFRDLDNDELADKVVRLANTEVEGPRHILFGINAGAVEGTGLVGIDESVMAALKKASRLLSAQIDPDLDLAFMFDKINGKLIGALEIDGCHNGPYAIDPDFFDTMALTESAIRKDAAPQQPSADEVVEPIEISVTFSEPAGCELLELPVPDTSNPPSAREEQQTKPSTGWKKALRDTVETVNTGIFHLTHRGQLAADSDKSRVNVLLDILDGASNQFVDADNYYFFEEKAVKVNLTVCNKDILDVKDASIEISLPRARDFDVADHLYICPDDDSPLKEAEMVNYPEVRRSKSGIWVRSSLGLLATDKPRPAFETGLRLVVGPSMAGRKVGVSYTIRGENKQILNKGTIKIKFGRLVK